MMSFDLPAFDSDLFSSYEFLSSESDQHQFLSHDFSAFDDVDDHHHAIIQQNPDEIFQFYNQTVTTTPPSPSHFHTQFSLSPPSNKMGYLSIASHIETTCTDNFQSVVPNGSVDFSGFDFNHCHDSTVFHGNAVAHHGLHRSYSSNCFNEETRVYSQQQQPQPNSAMKAPSFILNGRYENSPEKSFFSAQIRRVCSAGDIQEIKTPQTMQKSIMGRSLIEESNFKVGKYTADERKERIHKYRAKRAHRNFNKTIKYACRKALADNRPRIRGRFARNDEIGDAPNTTAVVKEEEDDDDDIWVDRLNNDEELYQGTIREGQFANNYEPTVFQYYGH